MQDAAPMTVSPQAEPIRLVQVTDPHLGATPGATLVGMDTDHSLDCVLAMLKDEPADLILATGDISAHGGEDAYRRFHDKLEDLAAPSVWLAGNHDDQDIMAAVVGQGQQLSRSVFIGGWHVVMLNSTIPGEVPGELGEEELIFLDECLAGNQHRHTLVCLHHHPVPVGCDWLDQQVVADYERFFRVLDGHSQVRAVLWGHVHQEYHARYKQIELIGSPSTCIQFAPNNADFALDDKAPGYRWLKLFENGAIETGVERVRGVDFKVDFTIQGY
jgi:Icc protein